MATKDIRSQLVDILTLANNLNSNGSTNGLVVDTEEYISIMFTYTMEPYSDGTHTITVFHADDPGFTMGSPIPSENVLGTFPVIENETPQSTNLLRTWGIFGNKRFIRVNVVSTDTTGSQNRLKVHFMAIGKDVPVDFV